MSIKQAIEKCKEEILESKLQPITDTHIFTSLAAILKTLEKPENGDTDLLFDVIEGMRKGINNRLQEIDEKIRLLDIEQKGSWEWLKTLLPPEQKAENSEPKPEPWRPKEGETYWMVNLAFCGVFEVILGRDDNTKTNCFRTREDAERFLEKIKKLREEME